MEFEFNPEKSASNKAKHGIDFVEAQALWNDSHILTVSARTENEARFLVIAKVNDRQRSAVITYRQDRIRIISVRRSRREEVEAYESRGI